MPTRGDAFGHVFCEANAYGLPAIGTKVGGVTEIIKDNINGCTFPLEARIDEYAEYLISLIKNEDKYKEISLNAFNEYKTRLNWEVNTKKAYALMQKLTNKN